MRILPLLLCLIAASASAERVEWEETTCDGGKSCPDGSLVDYTVQISKDAGKWETVGVVPALPGLNSLEVEFTSGGTYSSKVIVRDVKERLTESEPSDPYTYWIVDQPGKPSIVIILE